MHNACMSLSHIESNAIPIFLVIWIPHNARNQKWIGKWRRESIHTRMQCNFPNVQLIISLTRDATAGAAEHWKGSVYDLRPVSNERTKSPLKLFEFVKRQTYSMQPPDYTSSTPFVAHIKSIQFVLTSSTSRFSLPYRIFATEWLWKKYNEKPSTANEDCWRNFVLFVRTHFNTYNSQLCNTPTPSCSMLLDVWDDEEDATLNWSYCGCPRMICAFILLFFRMYLQKWNAFVAIARRLCPP